MNCSDFAVFILTNGRPNNVKTIGSLKKCGYTGKVFLLVDDLDKTRDEYVKNFGDQVVIFDKKEIAATFDQGDNFNDMRAIVYARNASFKVARDLGVKYFIQLDDDYTKWDWRFNENLDYCAHVTRSLDQIFFHAVEFFKNTNVASIAFSQGGDFIGGSESVLASHVKLKRKCMNSFICSTDRPFSFVGRINEDVNTYTRLASTGLLFFTMNHVSLTQTMTQANPGGMTELYLDSGTYIKSFYSVMYHPSSVKIKTLDGGTGARLHHGINWKHTVPMILRESLRKTRGA